ncbi:BREX-2 system phosphatase PglZ [Sorangium sp. So ce1153]|uniref:BREX-2 system phosphatase PglZ n=1 Tax=Sorangium sp. So ce1153 TaxID=3133333 RepID=UPI003F60AB98
MSEIPRLSRHDLTEQLEKLYRSERKRHLVAFFGTGEEEELRFANMDSFHVVPVRSELELRERLPSLDDNDARIAFLVPWGTEVPLDLAGRFARSGRILRVGTEARLLTLLGASEVEDEARRSRLATYLLSTSSPASIKVPAGRVTLTALWNAWLGAVWGIDISGGLGLDTLLGWAALDQRGARFVEAMSAAIAAGVRDELLAHLTAQFGAAGPVVWKAWENARGSAVLAYALLFETLSSSEHAGVKMWVGLAPRAALGVTNESTMAAVARALGASADGALRHVEKKAGATLVRTIVQTADALVENADVREALATDRRLPSAWRARLDTLGRTLTAAAEARSVANVERAAAAYRALEGHMFFTDADETVLMARAEMAVRLAAWLCVRPDRDLQGAPTLHADAELLARWYAAEGGYVDWARRNARGTAEDVFGKGVNAVVAAADAAREELDRRFARSLSSWVEAGRPSAQVVPIDQAVKRIAVRFLEDDDSRKLLVLLMDGMAWAQAVELLQSLGARTVPWGPLAWHGSAKGKIGNGIYPAVLANLPTMTDVSRAAFFGGKALPPGAAWNTAKDVERWAEHREVKKLFAGSTVPRLLLRGEGHTLEGSASPEALSLVADRTRRVVAIVINAIDASLKGDPQQRHAWTVESIKSLPDLLDRAREAGRAVLLASDHGHVPADRLVSKGSYKDAGARWRPWTSPDEALAPYEVGFRGDTVCSPKGAHGVVLLADDASRYGGGAHAGEHGGATLAEVVAPCLLIGCEDLGAPAHDDRALDVGSAHVPPWWYLEVRTPMAAPEVTPVEIPVRPRKQASQVQLGFPALAEPIPPPAPAPAPVAKPSTFASSPVLASLERSASDRKQIVEAVDFLLARQGVASEAALASALNVPAWRIGGVVAKLGEILNVDGYQVIRHDSAAKTVHLDREKLAQQFEVQL